MEIKQTFLVVHNNFYSLLIMTVGCKYFVQDVLLGGQFTPCSHEKAKVLIKSAEYLSENPNPTTDESND